MTRQYVNAVHETIPRFNHEVASGFARSRLEQADAYVDSVIRCAAAGYPEGLVYEGYSRVRPQDIFKYFSSDLKVKRGDKRYSWDFARNDMYLVRYHFSYKGERLKPMYLYLPFVNDCAMMYINGKAFYIKPVVADPVISVTGNEIFVPLNSTPCSFFRSYYMIIENGTLQHQAIYDGCFHHTLRTVQKQHNKLSQARITTNAHYLFVKYGLAEAFEKYCNCTIVVGNKDTVNLQTHPSDEWNIYESTGQIPTYYRNKAYRTHGVKIAVLKEDISKEAISMIASVFYVLDMFPDEVENPEYIKDWAWWALMMGKIIFGESEIPGNLVYKIKEHIAATDRYVDEMAMDNFRNEGILVDNMYDFLFYLIERFDTLITSKRVSPSSMAGKRLTVRRYVLSSIIVNMFDLAFSLADVKANKLDIKKINQLFTQYFQPRLITGINSGRPYVSAVTSPCDCRVLKITSEVLPQANARNKKAKLTAAALRNPRWFLDSSMVDIGGATMLSKGEPLGLDKINPFATVGPGGVLKHNPKFLEITDEIAKKTSRR